MDFVIFDLEWNGCFSKKINSYINEIIEFGAVRLNEDLEITGKFNCLVRPVISTRLSSSVKTLTSLSYEDLQRGVPFDYGYNKFRKFASGCILMTWSKTDLYSLLSNLRFHRKLNTIPFMKQYVDLQRYCHDMLGLSGKNALGLQTAADLLKIDTDEIPHHRALGDSIITALCLSKLYHKAALETYTENCEKQFYDELTFRSFSVESLDSEYADLSSVFFNCPECGARCRKKDKWKEKYKGFGAPFICPVCGFSFTGRVTIKRKYDETLLGKKVIRYPVQQSENTSVSPDS